MLFFILLVLHVAAGIYFNGYSAWWLLACVLALVSILALGSILIHWNFYMPSVNTLPILKVNFNRGQLSVLQRGRQVALTFDDGPAAHTEAILDILKKEGVQATFFLIGKNIEGREALVQRMLAEGHSIGNHSFDHGFNFDWQSAAKMEQEILRTNEAIEAITGTPVKLFRPPYGVTNPNLAKAVRNSGMKSMGWSLRSMDTVAKDKDQLLGKIMSKVKAGDIILLHDRCAITETVLPELIKSLKEQDYTFASL
ncbi:polysaccharide deacetylase family protein [Taibaiella helva]|uniref:polysaccharide deacetylase family protein n=1 Tax=Taibaiella helva TaxID=2301235 RepID=UPI000E56C185|nr:polysaccharide deacetylase family protein [Taibaiella helva]